MKKLVKKKPGNSRPPVNEGKGTEGQEVKVKNLEKKRPGNSGPIANKGKGTGQRPEKRNPREFGAQLFAQGIRY